jgi:hypothetical protein
MITKMDSVVDGINQALTGPLVDQNRNYVRYDIRVNKAYFDKVADPSVKWYIFEKQSRDPTRPNEFPDGVIELKAAWKELVAGQDDPSRYYTVNALIVQTGPVTPKCRQAQMGLIGFHIANKVTRFREWVWSTFEHVDNVPEGVPVPGQKYSLNNGTDTPPTAPNGFDHMPPKIKDNQPLPPIGDPQRTPVQTSRLTPISPSGQVGPTTDQINAQWQQALAGTVWQNYKLVATQWPTVPNGQNFKSGGAFPVNSDTPFPAANVANTTMETYLQRNSCMRCHYAAAQDDFSFLLKEAFHTPPPMPSNLTMAARAKRNNNARLMNNPTEQKLLQVLAENDRQNKQAVLKTNRMRRRRAQ